MKNYFDQTVKTISESVRFASVQGKAEEGAPFGKEARACLDHFLAVAEEMGFQTINYDGYAGEVTFGDGEEEVAVLGHLDVVPAGNGWTHDPFGGELDEDRIWGRGTVDDKGPIIICLYALKALKDSGFVPSKKIKLIVGCNEESGSLCMKHYKEVAKMPDIGFSPDADFPIIYAEKGIYHVCFEFPSKGVNITGGEKANMVCDLCTSETENYDEERAKKYSLSYEGGKLISIGKGAHGSTPEKGVNAIAPMLSYYGFDREVDLFFNNATGIKDLCDVTGHLTFSPNVIRTEGDKIKLIVDIRYPATMKKEQIDRELEKFGIEYSQVNYSAPLYNDKDSFLISTLLKVYNAYTGENAEPIAIGGGTYAKELKCGAGFGPVFIGDEEVIHQANEYIRYDRIVTLLEIYFNAIKELSK